MSFARRHAAKGRVRMAELWRTTAARAAALTVGMFVVGYFLATSWLFPAAEDPTEMRFVEVPDLETLSLAEAAERVSGLGLGVALRPGIRHLSLDSGTVAAQSPLPGQLARPGDTVRLTPSLGPDVRVVPDLAGIPGNEAARILRALGFEVAIVREAAGGTRAGVLATRPAPGTRVPVPARLELVVAEGAPIVEVPDLRGRHVDDVPAALEEGELQLGAVRYQVDASEAPGRVVSQSPAPGSALRGGGFVSIVVAGTPPDSASADLAREPDLAPAPVDTLDSDDRTGLRR